MKNFLAIIAILSLFKRESTHTETDTDEGNTTIIISDLLSIPESLSVEMQLMGAAVYTDDTGSSVILPEVLWKN